MLVATYVYVSDLRNRINTNYRCEHLRRTIRGSSVGFIVPVVYVTVRLFPVGFDLPPPMLASRFASLCDRYSIFAFATPETSGRMCGPNLPRYDKCTNAASCTLGLPFVYGGCFIHIGCGNQRCNTFCRSATLCSAVSPFPPLVAWGRYMPTSRLEHAVVCA